MNSRVVIVVICALGVIVQAEGDDSKPIAQSPTEKERLPTVREGPQFLIDVLNVHVQAMFREPSAEALEASRLELINKDVKTAKSESWTWIRKVIDEKHAPKADETMQFLCAPTGVDTTRVVWNSGEWRFDVCQTRTAFTMKVSSLKEASSGLDAVTRAAAAKEICQAVFVDSCQVHLYGTAERTAVDHLKETLCNESFAKGEFLELPGDKVVVVRRKRVIVANSPKDLDPFQFWYRQLGWWHDGKTVGFFFPKLTGPGGGQDLSGRYDKAWFERSSNSK